MAGMRHAAARWRPPTTSSARAPTPTGWRPSSTRPTKRRRYIATFYTSRFWAHPGAFSPDDVDLMTEPFGDGDQAAGVVRAPTRARSTPPPQSEPSMMAGPNPTPTLILFGPSDHVIYPDFDRMAAVVFPDHVGPFLVRDAGHFLQWEAADVLNSAVRSFCGDLLAANSPR